MTAVFQKNKFPYQSKPDFLAIDCHFHSRYSDGSAKISDIIEHAAKKNIGIAITDHNEIKGAIEAFNNQLGVPVIPGIEISCREKMHLLFYFYSLEDLKLFYKKHVFPHKIGRTNLTLFGIYALKIAKAAQQYRCLVGVAHPFSTTQKSITTYLKKSEHKDFFSYIDFIEGINGTSRKKNNLKGITLAKKLQKPLSGGSDGHNLSAMGDVLTISKATTITTFLDNLKQGKCTVVGKKSNMYKLSKNTSVLSYKHLKESSKNNKKVLLTSLGLYALLQTLTIPLLFLLGSATYKKITSRKKR